MNEMASFDGHDSQSDVSDWELSKENVLPLRRGRNVQRLMQSQSDDEASKRHIKEQQHAFETELRIYSGDDPLDVWDRYIKWTEQNYSKGGQENNMEKILESCAHQFKDTEKYANDPRYLAVWLRFIRFCPDGFEIFNFLCSSGIGVELAALYEAWAALFESIGNTKRADLIFNQGIEREAHPVSSLHTKHREFQARVARQSVSTEQEPSGGGFIPHTREEQRTTLGDLRGVGKRQHAPHGRVGDAKLSHRGGLKSSLKPLEPVINGIQSFGIHTDVENNAPALPVPGAKEWETLPSGKERYKENDRAASQWGKAKVRKHAPHLAMSEVSKMAMSSIQVHEDAENISATSRNVAAVECVLSARKADKPSDLVRNIQSSQQKPAASSSGICMMQELPMYSKNKVYSGAGEFSFEEIRAIRYQEKQRKIDEAAEKAEQEAQRQKAFMADCQRLMKEQMLEQWQQQQSQIQQLQSQLQECLKTRAPSPGQADSNGGVTPVDRLPMRPMGTSNGSLPTPDPCISLQSSGEKNNFNSTPQLTTPQLASSNSSSLLSGPSPTVNTQMAFNQVREWYGNSIVESEFAAEFGNFDNEPVTTPAPKAEPAKPAFAVFDENASVDKENSVPMREPQASNKPFFGNVFKKPMEPVEEPPSAAPFAVYEDNSAQCMAPSVKRQTLGTVRPRAASEDEPMQQEVCSGGSTFFAPHGFDCDDPDDMTFDPKYSSTCNFTASGVTALPPMDDMMPFNPEVSKVEDTTAASAVFMDSTSTAAPDEPPSQVPASVRPKTNHSRRSSCIRETTTKLSPIEERSDESTFGSSNGHSTMAATTLGHTTLHGTSTASVAPVAEATDLNRTCHEIDVTGYFPPDEPLVQEQLNASIAIDTHDPFDEKLIRLFLSRLPSPIELHRNYHNMSSPMPHFASNKIIKLGGASYRLTKKIGQGGFASVFACEPCVENEDDSMDLESQEVVIKVQKPPCIWEFYISNEILERSAKLPSPLNMQDVTMTIKDGFFYTDGSCLLNQRHEYGTLLDLANACTTQGLRPPMEFMAYLGSEILLMMEMLSQCDIIHGDVKPDNFLIMRFPRLKPEEKLLNLLNRKQKMLKLIDFGRSIDMRQFPSGTTFSASVNTSGFQCIEMKTNRPWTYQTDLFGVVGSLYVLLFGKYMDITFNSSQLIWKTTGTFKRFWPGAETWKRLFNDFLNTQSCNQLPDITEYRLQLEEIVQSCTMTSMEFNACMEGLEKALIRV